MQFKSVRGVQQVDVSGAADALIAEGLRPTIERVRQKMGRGSPNTVSPMLDAWFASLGARLTGHQSAPVGDAIPHLVQDGMKKLWDVALTSGREEASLQIVEIQAYLEGERTAIAAKAADFSQQEQRMAERMQASMEALEALKMQMEDLRGQHAEVRKSLKAREADITEQRAKLDAMEQAGVAQRRKAADDAAQQARERERADERAASTERRLLQEVDRARQETKLLRVDAQELEKRHAAQQSQWEQHLQDKNLALSQALEQSAQKSRDLQTTRDALEAADLKTGEIKALFQQQQLANEDVIAQLTRALTTRPPTRSRTATALPSPKTSRKLGNTLNRTTRTTRNARTARIKRP